MARDWSARSARSSASARADSAAAARCSAAPARGLDFGLGRARVAEGGHGAGEPLGDAGQLARQVAHLPEHLGAGDPGHGDRLLDVGLAGGDAALCVGLALALAPRGHGVVRGSAQYSGGRPGLAAAGSGAFSQPGNLHVAVLVCSVMMAEPSSDARSASCAAR